MGLFDALFKKEYINLSNDDLKKLMTERKDIQYVDVRTKPEYKHRRIRGFNKNIDFYKFTKNPSITKENKFFFGKFFFSCFGFKKFISLILWHQLAFQLFHYCLISHNQVILSHYLALNTVKIQK